MHSETSVSLRSRAPHGRPFLTAALAALAAGVFAGCPTPPEPVELPPPAQVLSFTVSSPVVSSGETVTLSWQTQDAVSVELRDVVRGVVSGVDPTALNGSVEVTIEQGSLFVFTAANARGQRDSASVAVQLEDQASEVFFIASPSHVAAGQSVTLAWSAPGARDVSLATADGTPVDLGGQLTSGSVRVTPEASTTWQLSVDGKIHEAHADVGAVIADFSANPSAVVPGAPVTLNWRTVGASRLTLTRAGYGEVVDSTDPAQLADGSFTDQVSSELTPAAALTYVLRAYGEGGDVVEQAQTLYVAGEPEVVSFQVPRYGLKEATFTASWVTTGADEVELLADGVVVHRSSSAASAASGSVQIPTPAQEVEYQLRAVYKRGGSALSDAFPVAPVGIPSQATFTAAPDQVTQGGDPVVLSWNVPEARQVRIGVKDRYLVTWITGLAAESGSVTVYPNAPTEYVLEADNTIGHAIVPQTVVATATTPASLSFTPSLVPYGGNLTLGTPPVQGVHHAFDFALRNSPQESFIDISGDGQPTGHPVSTSYTMQVVELGETFSFPLFDQVFTTDKIAVNNRGWFSLDPTAAHNTTTPPSTWATQTLPPYAFAPYWELLQKDASAELYWRLDGAGPDRRLIVQWDNVRYSSTTSKRMTFQAQLYASGKVVFAYPQVYSYVSSVDLPSIGIVGPDGVSVVQPRAHQLDSDSRPFAGDTFTFFAEIPAGFDLGGYPEAYTTLVKVQGGGVLELSGTPNVLMPGRFWISEVMPSPDTAVAPAGEWFKLTNATDTAYDLSGWSIDFGNGQMEVIPASANLVLPAQGTLLFAQSGDPAQNGGLNPDYVWSSGYSLPDAAGIIGIAQGISVYDSTAWGAGTGHGTGVSFKRSPALVHHMYLPGVTDLTCAGSGSYGTQTGSPHQRSPGCFPYRMSFDEQGAFESIENTGTKISGTQTQNFLVTLSTSDSSLPVPIKWGNGLYNTLTVSDNGYIALRDVPAEAVFTCSDTNCHSTNKTAFNDNAPTRLVAPFWDLLSFPTGTGGIYMERKNPDPAITGDEYTIISWEHIRYSTTASYDLNFQVKFFDSGDIEYHYGTMTGSTDTTARGNFATIWLESEDGRAALVRNITSVYGELIQPNSAVKFRFVE